MQNNNKVFNILICSILGLLLNACAVGPDYVRPPTVVPSHYKEAKGKKVVGDTKNWKVAHPQELINRGEWWKIFHEPTLNALEDQLNVNNQNIENAIANFRQARALIDQARAGWFPTLSAGYTITRQKTGGGSASFVSSSASGTSAGTVTGGGGNISSNSTSNIFSSHSLLLNASWEIDLWGGTRRQVEASVYGAQASAALLAETRLSMQASLAQYYFEIRTVDLDQRVLNDIVKGYQRTLRLTKNQYAAGIVSRADVVQAQSQVDSAIAQALNNKITRAQYEHAIAVLIGVPPADFYLAVNALHDRPPPIPLEIPTALLERRPDIAQAERNMAQANAEIGVAISAYFPTLTLTGTGSSQGRGIGFTIPNFNWSLAAQLAGTILDGGYRTATVRAAKAQYAANVALYRQTVLAAFQDVEDNLVALRVLKDQARAQFRAVVSANRALEIVLNQYKAGTVPYATVIIAQIQAYTARKNAVDVAGLQMTAAVGLIKAIGGGWFVGDIYAWCDPLNPANLVLHR